MEPYGILVPIDFREDSRLGLQVADCQAEEWQCDLILLHVRKTKGLGTKGQPVIDEEGDIHKWLPFVKQTPLERVVVVICHGDPTEEILRAAKRYEVRAIVMGRGGQGTTPGSVARQVEARHAGSVELVSSSSADMVMHTTI